ncbi:hypothetical protein OAC85_01325 [Flavobacteriaceae bacterium]|nr:hypothetical protein [Flavobacteriaceae bacterium]
MGTEHPDYVKVYDEIQERRFGVDTSSPSFSLKRIFSMFLPVIFGFVMISVQAQNTSIEGKWRDNKEGGIILIYKNEGLYYGQLISTDNAKVNMKIQKQEKIIIMKGFQQKNPP